LLLTLMLMLTLTLVPFCHAGAGSGVAFFLLTFLGAAEVRRKKSERLPCRPRLDRPKKVTHRATEERTTRPHHPKKSPIRLTEERTTESPAHPQNPTAQKKPHPPRTPTVHPPPHGAPSPYKTPNFDASTASEYPKSTLTPLAHRLLKRKQSKSLYELSYLMKGTVGTEVPHVNRPCSNREGHASIVWVKHVKSCKT
jgi:hypothetical protein